MTHDHNGTPRRLAPDLWIADEPLSFLGIELGARMTVVRLPDSRLLLHSPISRSAELAAWIERLGTPAFLIAPNRFHHLYVGEWKAAYPAAGVYVAPGLERKRPDLVATGILGNTPAPEWSEVLDQVVAAGFPLANEVVFFHKPSSTLIASDLVFNVDAASPALTRLVFRLMGAYDRPSTTLLERLLIRDREAFRASLARIQGWPVSRLILAHGSIVEKDGGTALSDAYSWLMRGAAEPAPTDP